MQRLKRYWNQEMNKIRRLEGHARLEYIWQYYRLWIIGILCAVGFTIYMIWNAATALPGNYFFITFAGTRADVGNHSALWDGYVQYTGFDTTLQNVEFNNAAYFDYAKNQGFGNNYYNMFIAHIDSGTLDAVTMEEDALRAFGSTGRLLDLNREECRSLREKYGDRLIYTQANSDYSTEPVPIGIDIHDSILMTKYSLYPESCALGIGSESTHIEAVELFLDYIFEEDDIHE